MRATTKILSAARSRWAAVIVTAGLCATTFGGTQVVADLAANPSPAFFPITPCRLADTRPGAIGPDSSIDLDGWGEVGDCVIPIGTKALAINVTAVGATESTNLRFYPYGTDRPETANLNPKPGSTTSNAANVALSEQDGRFSVYNRFGNVAVVIDVMGYFRNHDHDELYYRKGEIDELLAPLLAGGELLTKSEATDHFAHGHETVSVGAVQSNWETGTTRSKVALCPDGMSPVGGGASTTGGGLALESSFPYPFNSNDPTGWFARFTNISGQTINSAFRVMAVCMYAPNP